MQFSLSGSTQVLAHGDGFKVLGVDTLTDVAKVIQCELGRNWPHDQFINNAMSQQGFTLAPPYADAAVTIWKADSPSPNPTSVRLANLRPELGLQGQQRCVPLAGHSRPSPMTGAKATCNSIFTSGTGADQVGHASIIHAGYKEYQL